MKLCKGCDKRLPAGSFHVDHSKPDGRRAQCKGCRAGAYAGTDVSIDEGLSNQVRLPTIEVVQETITRVEEHRLKQQVRRLESELKTLVASLSDVQEMNDLRREVESLPAPAPIQARERASGLREGTALICASDWHIEEQVRPEQVSGRNRYNLEISKQRMGRFFQASRWALDFSRQAYTIREVLLWLGGDLITNYLHDDNIETNLLSPVQAIAYAFENIIQGIDAELLSDPLIERLTVNCNDGNHGRLTEKTRSASRTANSIEWLLYTMLMRHYANDRRVVFNIAEGSHLYHQIYGRTVRFVHGDICKYGGGVGGITIPIYKALGRWDTTRRADLTVMGHFHQLTNLRDLIINGSLIGFSPYAIDIGARFEEPAQAFQILDSTRFKGPSMPLWVSNREDDNG